MRAMSSQAAKLQAEVDAASFAEGARRRPEAPSSKTSRSSERSTGGCSRRSESEKSELVEERDQRRRALRRRRSRERMFVCEVEAKNRGDCSSSSNA